MADENIGKIQLIDKDKVSEYLHKVADLVGDNVDDMVDLTVVIKFNISDQFVEVYGNKALIQSEFTHSWNEGNDHDQENKQG